MSICKEIYSEKGYLGIMSVLNRFPERLHEEMLEDLSLNMIEWESKLTIEEKEEMSTEFVREASESAMNDVHYMNNLNYKLEFYRSKVTVLKQLREDFILNIQDYPSISPEDDINRIGEIDEEILENEENIDKANMYINIMILSINKKRDRLINNLFE